MLKIILIDIIYVITIIHAGIIIVLLTAMILKTV